MTDDLRTLAAEAIRELRGRYGPLGDGSLRSGCAGELADAVLAAVLPAHRRQVLAEAEAERMRQELTGWFLSNDDLRRREQVAHERGRAAMLAEVLAALDDEGAVAGRADRHGTGAAHPVQRASMRLYLADQFGAKVNTGA